MLFDIFQQNSTFICGILSSQKEEIVINIMYEINLSTLVLIGLDNNSTKVITTDGDFIVKDNCKRIVDDSCRFFGSSLLDRVNATKRLVKMSTKTPIVIEDTRNIIFFPLKSTRDKINIWVSFNNLDTYQKNGDHTLLIFKSGRTVELPYSYYIVDNQVTRSIILDYESHIRRKSLE